MTRYQHRPPAEFCPSNPRSAPRGVKIDIFARIATTSTGSATVDLPGFVVDVGTFASFRRNVTTGGRFVSTRIFGTVTVLQVALRCMVGAIVFIAGIARASAKAVRRSISVARFEADVVDRLGRFVVGHDDLRVWNATNARRSKIYHSGGNARYIFELGEG